jgi:hypothetical protein
MESKVNKLYQISFNCKKKHRKNMIIKVPQLSSKVEPIKTSTKFKKVKKAAPKGRSAL